jgi:transketolase
VIVGDFQAPDLTEAQLAAFARVAREARGDVLKMTTLAASGHPGGAMSTLDFELVLWGCGRFDPSNPFLPDRDRVVVSHGHTSAAAYAILARLGWFDPSLPLVGFRRGGSPFEGHVERDVPGIEWATGNLGQGLSAAAAFALAARLRGDGSRVFCTMGDGEQQKGQLSEARRFASREGLTNLVALLDWNRVQLSGDNAEIMPQDILAGWRSDGWEVLEVDGHSHRAVFHAVRAALASSRPAMIACHTVMSKGVPFMEAGGYKWHGAPLSVDQCRKALEVLGLPDDLDAWTEERKKPAPDWKTVLPHRPEEAALISAAGAPRTYAADKATDNRSAFGTALADLGDAAAGKVPMVVVDCDLSVSTKTDTFLGKHAASFFQCGISEHHAAVLTGALSLAGVSAWWGEFAMFGVAETYNQQRLNDINGTNAKLCVTHAGIDVGEDGKTHHSIDYFGLLNSTYSWHVYTPADPNQTDRIVRWMAANRGNHALVMGRSKCPVVVREDGTPYFAGDWTFDPRRADEIRTGEQLSIVAAGNMLPHAFEAWKLLVSEGTRVDLFSVAAWTDLGEGSLVSMARHGRIVAVEDHNPKTGLGTLLQARLNDLGLAVRVRKLGVPSYASSGPAKELYRRAGLDPQSIARAAREELLRREPGGWIPAVGSTETF